MTPTPEPTTHSGRTAAAAPVIVTCNGADCTDLQPTPIPATLLSLDYRPTAEPAPNVKIGLPDFVRSVYHLPDRLLDLLEIAAYVYCADRFIRRGAKDALEYHAWSRSLQFFVRVRDHAFWQQPAVAKRLDELLRFLSGNQQMRFCFQPGHSTSPTNLFDSEEFALEGCGEEKVVLFSGGVDSLAGIVGDLRERETKLCLVSHRSKQPSIGRTQQQLLKALSTCYPGRVRPYRFDCHLTSDRAAEETQRTRFFLYTVIAFVLARSMGSQEITVFENGVTSLNLPKRQDMMHGRASRTTHPKTITLLRQFFSSVADAQFDIITPFAWKTKADVMEVLRNCGGSDLLSSSVSCSKTFKVGSHGTHCGGCSQCVDRRFAAFASRLDDYDECGLYSHDFLTQSVTEAEAKTTLLDYLRQACDFAGYGLDQFYTARASDLLDIVEYLDGMTEEEAVEVVWSLYNRHGSQVIGAVTRMRESLRAAGVQPPAGSALHMIDEEAHAEELQPMREAASAPDQTSIPAKNLDAALLTTREPEQHMWTPHPSQGTKLAAPESCPEQGDKRASADVAIVTALPKELDAVIRHLSRHAEVHTTQEGNRTYHRCTTKSGLNVVAAVMLGMGQINAALLVRDLVAAWKPSTVLLVGIAAGIGKDISLGDVVVSDQIVDYEAGKVTPKGTEPRWSVYRSDPSLLDRAVNFRDRTWVGEIAVERPDGDRQANPRIHTGVVLSGNKVIADADVTGEWKDVWSRALAVEMEAAGAAAAIYQMRDGTQFIMVKGVCDRADAEKDDRWQEYAADVAAAFTAAFVGLKVQP